MNKRGQVAIYALMLSVVVVILGLAFAPVIQQFTGFTRGNSTSEFVQGLDCTNESISDFNKGTCVFEDLKSPYFFFVVITCAGIIIGAKILWS